MRFKVFHVFPSEGVDGGEGYLNGLDVTVTKEMWLTEEELIEHGGEGQMPSSPSHPSTR